jgi:hypothetical protein
MAQLDWKIEDFRAWLLTLEPNVGVGFAGYPHQCPISEWRGVTARQCVGVGSAHITIGEELYQQPAWLRAFVRQIDTTVGVGKPVTAKVARETLDTVIDSQLG